MYLRKYHLSCTLLIQCPCHLPSVLRLQSLVETVLKLALSKPSLQEHHRSHALVLDYDFAEKPVDFVKIEKA